MILVAYANVPTPDHNIWPLFDWLDEKCRSLDLIYAMDGYRGVEDDDPYRDGHAMIRRNWASK
jgi:hypothetical protein